MGGVGSGRRKSPETIAREMAEANAARVDARKATAKKAVKKTTAKKTAAKKTAKKAAAKDETALELNFPTGEDRATLYEVKTPAGAAIRVQGRREQEFYKAQAKKYLEQNRFTQVADLTDLDQLLMQELLSFRWAQQLSAGQDYDNMFLTPAAEEQLRRNQIEAAKTIASIKTSLGLNRATRAASEGSVAEYLANLRRKAKEFGVHRNQQAVEAITLMNELASIVGTFDRSNDKEREKLGFTSEADIVAWVRDHAIPKFNKIDADFRAGNQKYWVGTL